MYAMRSIMIRFQLLLLTLVCASSVLAAEQETPQQHAWPWWHEGHGHEFWWIFPLMFFIIMIVMCFLMMRRGGMGCMWCGRRMGGPGFRDDMERGRGERSQSALEILDKRYARGEIEKQEYEDKKAAITRSG